MKIYRSDRFKKSYRRLPENVKKRFQKQLRLFAKNPKHPSLGTHAILNTPYREFRVDIQHRVVFRPHEDGIMLLDIGPHDVIDTWRRRR